MNDHTASSQTIEVKVGFPGNIAKGMIQRGTTVREAFRDLLHRECQPQWTFHASCQVAADHRIENPAVIVAVEPETIKGNLQVAPPAFPLRQFWRDAFRDLLYNLKYLWPVAFVIAIYVVLASLVVNAAEKFGIGKSIYFTWITMTTMGYEKMKKVGLVARWVASVDALVGMILFGIVVWVVQASLPRL